MRIKVLLLAGVFLVWATSAWAITLAWDPPSGGPTPTGYRMYASSTGMATSDFEMVWEGPELTCEVEVTESGGKYVFYVIAYVVDGDETLEGPRSRYCFYRTSAQTAINVTNPVQARTDGQGVTGSFH